MRMVKSFAVNVNNFMGSLPDSDDIRRHLEDLDKMVNEFLSEKDGTIISCQDTDLIKYYRTLQRTIIFEVASK